jgi:drug/metabolite transporter (DMT)-like permease
METSYSVITPKGVENMNKPPLSGISSIAVSSMGGLILLIGLLVSVNFALAKSIVLSGVPIAAAFYWQLVGASLILLLIILCQGQRLSLRAHHIRYYLIGGFLGVTAPQLVAYLVLKQVPAGLFTVLVTLSPMMTFILTSIVEKQLLPIYRLVGIAIGLAGVSIATIAGLDTSNIPLEALLIALCVPLLLGVTNVYRSKALPNDAHPLSLAAGTLASQAVLLFPVLAISNQLTSPSLNNVLIDVKMVALAGVTALSYILTFILQRKTDGVGFSQVGYFVTLGGIFIGAIFFNEQLSASLLGAVVLLFIGLAITNGHLSINTIFKNQS